jgi:asparagine synthetase B (glutamine-hydrolysing)
MCSFLVTNVDLDSYGEANRFAKYRGPDQTDLKKIGGINFLHNLLHITGEYTPQPIIDDDVVIIFNGEIYNFKDFGDFPSDSFSIMEAYKRHGEKFARHLDGEFAICIVDFKKGKVIISVDSFSCKPLWYSFSGSSFAAASYESQVEGVGLANPIKLYGNKTKVYDLKSLALINELSNVKFDLKQHKESFEDWILAFKNSIKKRTSNTEAKIFLGLSSGYDSGAIACELTNQGVPFKSYTVIGSERRGIISARLERIKESEVIELSKKEFNERGRQLNEECENFLYNGYNFKNDKASKGLAAICDRAKEEQRRIYMSGQGADEIISDYGFNGRKFYGHSEFGGKFPEDLDGFWPWRSFYDGRQIQYLNKEEYTAGHFGIETRYPFLDKDLVQEFLWLKSSLKNSKYKSALAEYLEINNFPFRNEKIGFNAAANLR